MIHHDTPEATHGAYGAGLPSVHFTNEEAKPGRSGEIPGSGSSPPPLP